MHPKIYNLYIFSRPVFIDTNITEELYLLYLYDFVDELRERGDLDGIVLFQQDGAGPHFGRFTRQYLWQTFGHRWIGRGAPVAEWPARSPGTQLNTLKNPHENSHKNCH